MNRAQHRDAKTINRLVVCVVRGDIRVVYIGVYLVHNGW